MIRNPAKALLRTKVKQTLRNMSPESRKEQSEVIFKKVSEFDPGISWKYFTNSLQVLQLPSLAAAQRISIYLSTETEVNTLPILEELLNMNKQVGRPNIKSLSISTPTFNIHLCRYLFRLMITAPWKWSNYILRMIMRVYR